MAKHRPTYCLLSLLQTLLKRYSETCTPSICLLRRREMHTYYGRLKQPSCSACSIGSICFCVRATSELEKVEPPAVHREKTELIFQGNDHMTVYFATCDSNCQDYEQETAGRNEPLWFSFNIYLSIYLPLQLADALTSVKRSIQQTLHDESADLITSLDRSISAASDEIAFLRARALTFRRRGAAVDDIDDGVKRDDHSAPYAPLSAPSKEEWQNPAENTQTPTAIPTAEAAVTRSSEVEGVTEDSRCPPRQLSPSTFIDVIVGESGRMETGSSKTGASIPGGYAGCVGSEEETACARKDGGIKANSRVDPSLLSRTRALPRSKHAKVNSPRSSIATIAEGTASKSRFAGYLGTRRKLRSEGIPPKSATISTEAQRGSATKKGSEGHGRYAAVPIIERFRSFGESHLSRTRTPPPLPPRSQPRPPPLHQEDARASSEIPTDAPETRRNRSATNLVGPSGLFARARTTRRVGARSLIVVDGFRLVWTLGIRDGVVSDASVTRCHGTNGYGRNYEYRV